ncbi:MAG: hypothetical protein ACFFDN_27295 [Candidatus Hodarchaeota archaeon]
MESRGTSREFLYVKNATTAIVLANEKFNKSAPINIGACFEVTIKDFAKTIIKITEFNGKIIRDSSKPDVQPRQMLDISNA